MDDGIRNQKSDVCIFQIHLCPPSWITKISAIFNAAYRNKGDFDPLGSQNPSTDFDETWHG